MSVAATPTGAEFNPVDTSITYSNGAGKDDVESPSLSSGNALARFEFEPGKSKDGTKVLMVEWEDDESTQHVAGDWEVRWEGKRTVLPAREHADDSGEIPVNRLYFLLGAGVPVPTAVWLQKSNVVWRTNPLPAIFSPELGASARQAGKKGVLHTIWAKKRLQVLQNEIDSEAKENPEGIGLQMAMAEKDWIEQNFGLNTKPAPISISTANVGSNAGLNSPTSPRTPGGGRLMEKLKGLKLGTSERELHTPVQQHNPLSPEGSDVAVSSFGSFAALKGAPPTSQLGAKPAQPPRKVAAQRPPDSLAAQQRQAGGMGSLNALASSNNGSFDTTGFSRPTAAGAEDEREDDLFALPMSPRSPEMTKSPFSFASQDTTRYLKEGKA